MQTGLSARYCAMFTSFSLTRNADGIDSAPLWSILPVSNNIAELPGLALADTHGTRQEYINAEYC